MKIQEALQVLKNFKPSQALMKRSDWGNCALIRIPPTKPENCAVGFDTGKNNGITDLAMINDEGKIAAWAPCIDSLDADDWAVCVL